MESTGWWPELGFLGSGAKVCKHYVTLADPAWTLETGDFAYLHFSSCE